MRYWIVDDSGIAKQDKHSVGVARQDRGNLGKVDNCQVAVSLSVANDHVSLPVAWRLYLPQDWVADARRCKTAGVPEKVVFETKPAVALGQMRQALGDGVAVGIVLADAAYGVDSAFRAGVSELALSYVLGVPSTTSVWQPGTGPLPPQPCSGRGPRPTHCGATLTTNRFRSRIWRWACQGAPGARSGSGTPARTNSPRASRPCGCVRPTMTSNAANPGPRSGC